MHTPKRPDLSKNPSSQRIIAVYQAICAADTADQLATAIAWEQTVEIVPEAVHHQRVLDEFVGQVESVSYQDGMATITLSYNPDLVCGRVSALFNLAYGNVSMYPDVRLVDLKVPTPLAEKIGGPGFGISGLRQLTHTDKRPLLATALKPRGAPHQALADIAAKFAAAGGDIIKDDQNLIDERLEDFSDRIGRCQQAIVEANHRNNKHCLYFPHISGNYTEMSDQLKVCQSLGIRAVLTCPLVVGLDICKQLVSSFGMAQMGHPAMSGAFTHAHKQGIDAAVLLGTLYRLTGVDISVFPGPGGRLSLTSASTTKIQQRLTENMGSIKPALCCPAGGKSLQTLPGLLDQFGADTLYLVGGALLAHPAGISAATHEYLQLLLESV